MGGFDLAKKLITIITPVYNKAPYIKDWAEGLAKQTYLDKMKILATDDGSTDNSLELVKKYSAEYNLPIEITDNGENLGLMYTTKMLYKKIDTKFFAVLDADDYYISPQKIEKAVKFLQKHSDYSTYACNIIHKYPDGKEIHEIPDDMDNKTFSGIRHAPFFQTSATVFRNFFSTKLLNEIDKATGNKKRHAFEADSFRNLLAFHFGKLYFENSPDSVWRKSIGAWETLSNLNKEISIMENHYLFFDFYKNMWGVDDNALSCIGISFMQYKKILESLMNDLNVMNVSQFTLNESFNQILATKDNLSSAFGILIDYYKKFADNKLNIYG